MRSAIRGWNLQEEVNLQTSPQLAPVRYANRRSWERRAQAQAKETRRDSDVCRRTAASESWRWGSG